MDRYVDGFVLPVPDDNLDGYREMASEAGRLWIEHGALEYMECVGDDLHPDVGDAEFANFPDLIGADADETAIFSFIVFESREHRDEVNAAVMEGMEEGDDPEMPFDVGRMAWGGFRSIVAYED